MDIGIIGAGNVGTGIGKRLAAKGWSLHAQPVRDFEWESVFQK